MSSRPSRGAARLAAILDALPDALLLVNCNGTVVNANTIALETFEAPGTALVGRGLLDLLPEFDSKRIPGSMRRPDEDDLEVRTKPTRMVARRTDGSQFHVEVTSANLEDGRTPYESSFEAAWADHGPSGARGGGGPGRSGSYTGDELLMLVVRDLTGTLDTEAELARQQRQTEMILRAASEGVIGVDTEGKVVLINPAAAQILGYRASDLGGQELHPLAHHARADGTPLPYEETPLCDTLRSGRKHRIRAGQVLWAKNGQPVPVEMTTAPVRDGEQLVGAVLTFTDRRPYEAVTGRYEQLLAVLGEALHGPLGQLRGELTGLAADPAGQLWPEANQILHHLAAGYGRMTTLVDNVLGYQRLDAGSEKLRLKQVSLDEVVSAGVEGAVELIGPGRAQFAVHAPPIAAEVDPERLATALAHLIADVAGVDPTGNAPAVAAGGSGDSTIVVAAAQRGDVVRIEVRGPHSGGSPVHEPIVRGIVRRHGGVLQTHEVPGAGGGSAFVLEVPVAGTGGGVAAIGPGPSASMGSGSGSGSDTGSGTGSGSGPVAGPGPGASPGGPGSPGANGRAGPGTAPARQRDETTVMPVPAHPVRGTDGAMLATVSAAASGQGAPVTGGSAVDNAWVGDQDPRAAANTPENAPVNSPVNIAAGAVPAQARPSVQHAGPEQGAVPEGAVPEQPRPTGRRRGRPSPTEEPQDGTDQGQVPEPAPSNGDGSQYAYGSAAESPQQETPAAGTGRRARRALAAPETSNAAEATADSAAGGLPAAAQEPAGQLLPEQVQPGTGRRARRTAEPEQPQQPQQPQQWQQQLGQQQQPQPDMGRNAAGQAALPPAGTGQQQPDDDIENPPGASGGGRRARRLAAARARAESQAAGRPSSNEPFALAPVAPEQAAAEAPQDPRLHAGQAENGAETGAESPQDPRVDHPVVARSPILGDGQPAQLPQQTPQQAQQQAQQQTPQQQQPQQPAPANPAEPGPPGNEVEPFTGDARPRVRTLGQGVPFVQRLGDHNQNQSQGQGQGQGQVQAQNPAPSVPAIPSTPSTPTPPSGSGRRRRLATPPGDDDEQGGGNRPPSPQAPSPQAASPQAAQQAAQQPGPAREFAIGAPDAGAAEGPEPLDGPNGAVEVREGAGGTMPLRPVDDELPPEPLDNPRRLLVWPEPDVSTQQALSQRGYRPVLVHSREEVDAQIAAYPAALFVDPLTGPITRTALQSLRQAAVAAEVPVLVTAGLGQATREAAYGADPAVLLKALAPRDSEQHPPRVLLVEENPAIASALSATLERRGMQIAHAPSDADAVNMCAQIRPNLVVMDLMQIRRRRAGIIDWLRINGLLNRTPFVVYTSSGIDPADLNRLASGETVLFLAERSTNDEVQGRIVDLLAKIGAT